MKNYRDPITDLLITKFDADGPAELRGKYWHGNPVILPQNQELLPAVFISQRFDQANREGTDRDNSSKAYRLNVCVELKPTYLQSSRAVEVETRLQRYLCGVDENFDWLPDSFMYLLRKWEVLDGNRRLYIDLGTNTLATIQPGIETRGAGVFTYEGIIDFTVRHNQIRPSLIAS